MLLENLTIRHYQPSDLASIVDVYHAHDATVGVNYGITADMLRTFLESPTVDAANDTFIIERDGKIIGYADCELNPETGTSWTDAVVHPDYWNQGIGTQLLRAAETRVMERAGAETPPEMPIILQRHAADSDTAAIRLFEKHGYRHVRTFYRMGLDLNTPVEVPPLPEGIAVRPFEAGMDAHRIYETHQEAFADHWGFEPNTYEEWAHFVLNAPDVDVSMWLVAYEGEEIAGVCLNRPFGESDAGLAWVGTLAVRRPWRKHGLGTALLKRSFALFQERGYPRAGLGVDAASLTNAVALYERAGMHVVLRTRAYRKALRGSLDAS
jgi:mycothiol synthase